MSLISRITICITILFQTVLLAADDENFVLNKNGMPGFSQGYSAKSLGKSRLSLSFLGDFAYDSKMVKRVDKQAGVTRKEKQPFSVLYDFYPSAAYGITDNLDVSLSQPLYFDVIEGSLPSGGVGDLEASFKYQFFNNAFHFLGTAAMITVTVPYNLKKNGYFLRNNYYVIKEHESQVILKPYACYSSGKPDITLMGIASMTWKKCEFHINGGTILTINSMLDNVLAGSGGFVFTPAEMFSASCDISYKPRFDALSGKLSALHEPLYITGMTTIRTSTGVILSLGGRFRLTSQKIQSYFNNSETMYITGRLEPLWKAFLQFSWSGGAIAKDRDNDQIIDKNDACPDVAEDIDAFQDDDGCPDIDNDNDKIPDTHDACPNLAEDMDGFQDEDGCPDYDNDNDLIPDSLDACPGLPEDKDGFKDADGCPDLDNDEDGVPDSIDKCPTVVEDHDDFEDTDGCPDFDNDMDAVPDSIDKCPDAAGNAMNDGCPDQKAKEIRFGRLILPGVHFEAGSAEIAESSISELDRLIKSLEDWPEITIEIQCHTDNTIPQKKSLQISKQRADALCAYLVQKGIAPSRLKAVGKGSLNPIADNAAVEGRQLNDRVEIHRIK